MDVFYFLSILSLLVVCSALNDKNVDKISVSNKKRLLLHSEVDIAAELAKLNNNYAQLTSKLDAQQAEIRNLTKILEDKEKEVHALKTTVEYLNQRQVSGSTYTRWGRTSCPGNNTELVYKGYMGGTEHATTGGGVNFLCLTEEPQWDHYDENIEALSKIVGVEYQFFAFNQDGASQFFGKNILDDDALCAVCHSARGSSVMIPGRTECYGGWTKEYSGYIVGAFDGYDHPTEWICLDRRPDTVVGGKTNDNEALLYFVEASCGKSLECPPYVQGREITCVVCTK